MSKTPYIKRVPGRSGFYAQRAVPRPLQEKLGNKTWIRKVGNTMQEARRNLAEFLNFTDLEIVNASGEVNEALLTTSTPSLPMASYETSKSRV
ncbi:hypothetical protein KR52_10345 [Synechococcus sp. KORDI-52]|uniref:hypothetical protein n=1 Tax=Synechococcus sp. KORDI-52 TaxID=585425 RepID=UPI0004E06EC5|nr:hypothetical protein [Synechococcus sp. KORDI-52]AII49539.1 hypothetical protein KR52_10345 [Synechococcus sp. KORDI-52]